MHNPVCIMPCIYDLELEDGGSLNEVLGKERLLKRCERKGGSNRERYNVGIGVELAEFNVWVWLSKKAGYS